MKTQSRKTKLAESEFRAKITRQHLDQAQIFANEPNAEDIKQILGKRIKEAEQTFERLHKRHLKLSPYLEIGSEYCQRAAVLTNHFKADGFATDISLASLQAAPVFSRQFKFKKTPNRICADAYNLPFKSDTFPFVFIYETLHHFPDPKPVLDEIKRILTPGGMCLIGADPIAQKLQIELWRRPNKLRFWEKILKLFLVLPFISRIGKTEVEHGIIEGAFPLAVWQRAVTIFDKVEVKITVPFLKTETIIKSPKTQWLVPSLQARIILATVGGGLQALAFKKAGTQTKIANLNDLLICPNCRHNFHREIRIARLNNHIFNCHNCHQNYQKQKGVLVLLEKKLARSITKTIHQ